MTEDRMLNAREVAWMLQLSVRTLDRYRREGKGPHYYKLDRWIRYRQSDVIAWADTRRVGTKSRPKGESRQSGD